MKCRQCADDTLEQLIDFGNHPIAHHFLRNPNDEQQVYPVCLVFCKNCGLIQLKSSPDDKELYTNYVTLSSWKNQPHLDKVADLVCRYVGGTEAKILEIGSNDGIFLNALRKRHFTNIVGIEPADDAVAAARNSEIPTIHGYLNKNTAAELTRTNELFDVIVARQVLEHIGDLREFADAIKCVMAPNAIVLIEVPDGEFVFDNLDYSGIWEEHANYFTKHTLAGFFHLIDCEMIYSETVLFSGKSLVAIGKRSPREQQSRQSERTQPTAGNHTCKQAEQERVANFTKSWPLFKKRLTSFLEEWVSARGNIAVYGAGCRACSFVNYTGIGPLIDFFVDDQKEKQSLWMPGSKRFIGTSDLIYERHASLCILAVNAENENRVIKKHELFKSRGGTFFSILPPSEHLLPVWGTL